MKKIVWTALLLTLLLLTAVLAFTLPAAAETTVSGTCGAEGDNLTWTLDTESGVLTISGEGEMKNYFSSSNVPWYSYRNSIKTVKISDGITSIGWSAFSECSSLTSIEIPDSVASIGNSAFCKCSRLTSVVIGDGVTSISRYAFSHCPSIETMTVSSNNTKYHSAGNCIIETASKTLFLGCKNSEIPADGSVTSIGGDAFSGCSSLTSIEIPDSVTSIGDSAFCWCSSLTSIEIPDGVTRIGEYAFYGCSSLASIEIPDGVTSIDMYAFYECSSLTSIEIPNSVTSIGYATFFGCTSLPKIVFRSSTTTIYDDTDTIESDTVIYGYTGSTAEAYATKYNRTFVALHDPNTPCTFDQENVATKYLKSPATCTEQAVYYKSCLCGVASTTETFVYGEALGHSYDNADDTDCNVCGAVKYTVGDVDGNAGVSSDDAVYLLMHTFFPDEYPIGQPADYDGNGQVTSDDAVYLLMHTFFPDTYPLTQQAVAALPVAMATVEPKRDEEI